MPLVYHMYFRCIAGVFPLYTPMVLLFYKWLMSLQIIHFGEKEIDVYKGDVCSIPSGYM